MGKITVALFMTIFMLTGCTTGKTTQPAPEKQQAEKPVHCFDNGKKDDYISISFSSYSELPLKDVNDLADVDIAKKLFSLYLDSYKAPDRPLFERLAEYKIDDVTQVTDQGRIFFDIGFAVRPYQKVFYTKPHIFLNVPTSWIAGNGELRNDGWIVRKMMYVRLAKRDDQVRMILVGTGL